VLAQDELIQSLKKYFGQKITVTFNWRIELLSLQPYNFGLLIGTGAGIAGPFLFHGSA